METDKPQEQSGIKLRKEDVVGGPVTCVAVPTEEHCLIARGPWLEVCPLSLSNEKKQRHLIFPEGGTIHGIRESPELRKFIALFGGRQVCLVEGGITLDDDSLKPIDLQYQNCRQRHLTVSDWIWDVKLLSPGSRDGSTDELVMALALANNAVEIWMFRRIRQHFDSTDLTKTVFEASRCFKINGSTCCITYSMCFFGWSAEQEELVVASGTVSNEILLWSVIKAKEASQCHFNTGTMATLQKEAHRLVGHEGVIHSVTFSSTGDKLVSTSDDRTVRLWQRGQGHDWALVWTAWGHTARIWNATFASCRIVSSGEDGTVRVWSEKTGSQLAEIRNYNCQSQWCLDVLGSLAIVGCNDGSAKLYDISRRIMASGNRGEYGHGACVRTFLVPDDRIDEGACTGAGQAQGNEESTEASLGQNQRKKKITSQVICGMKFYCVSDTGRPDKILVATRGGSLYSFCLRQSTWTTLSPWYDASLANLKTSNGSCLAVHPRGALLALGTTQGQVLLLFDFEEATKRRRIVLDAQKYRSIQSLQWLDDETLLSFHIKGIVLCWRIALQQGSLQFVCDTTLGALPLCSAYDKAARYLFIGDSRGNITAFSLIKSESETSKILQPTFIVHRAHKKEHVTSMAFATNDRLLLSVGNDGCINKCSITVDGTWRHGISVPLSFVSGLSHIWLIENGTEQEQVIVGGYYSNVFVAADARTGYELFRVETGGRQRTQDCFIGQIMACRNTHGFVICVGRKDGRNELLLQNLFEPDLTPETTPPCKTNLGIALHGEPIFDSCFFQTRPQDGRTVILTGSEDTAARLSVYEASSLVSSNVLPPQESCVRAVAASRHPLTSSTLLAVGGGKLTLQFFLVEDNGPLNVSFLGLGRFPVLATIEHRINAVAAAPLKSEANSDAYHLVVTGDSKGSICIFPVSESIGASWHKHIAGYILSVQPRPILSLEILTVADRYILFAGTNGGEVLFWDLPCKYELPPYALFPLPPTGRYDAHQMGTNCLSSAVVRDSTDEAVVVVCSGGDDQAITVCEIAFHKMEKDSPLSSLEVKNLSIVTTKEASLSAIKGIHIIEPDLLVSVGYSQRLCIWRRSLDGSLHMVDSKAVDIADVNCLAYHSKDAGGGKSRQDVVAVLGEGVELFSIEHHATTISLQE